MTPLIIKRAPVSVAEHMVGFGYQLEPLLSADVAGITVRMVAVSELTEATLDIVERCSLGDTKNPIIVAVCLHVGSRAPGGLKGPPPGRGAPILCLWSRDYDILPCKFLENNREWPGFLGRTAMDDPRGGTTGRKLMSRDQERRDILAFAYGERLKSALLAVGQLLDAIANLHGLERQGALVMLASSIRAVAGDAMLAAKILGSEELRGLDGKLELVEGFVRLGEMAPAREELSRALSRVTTVSGRAMAALRGIGLL